MNIIYIASYDLTDCGFSSEGNMCYELIKYFNEHDINIYAITGKSKFCKPINNAKIYEIYKNYNQKTFNKVSALIFQYKVYKTILKIIREYDVDIIHRLSPNYYLTSLDLYSSMYLHSYNKLPFILGPIYPPWPIDIKPKTFTSNPIAFILRKFFERTLQNASSILVYTSYTKELLKSSNPKIDKSKIRVVTPAVDTSYFKPLSSEYYPKEPEEILLIGRLIKEKNIEVIIRSLKYVIKEYSSLKCTIVGEGPYKEELLNLVRKLDLNKYVVFIGYIKRQHIKNFYHQCNLLCDPTEHQPNKVLFEAMACGTPVLAPSNNYTNNIIIDGYNGFTVNMNNPKEISEKIIEILKNPNLVRKVRKQALFDVKKKFSIESSAKEILKIYEELVNQ